MEILLSEARDGSGRQRRERGQGFGEAAEDAAVIRSGRSVTIAGSIMPSLG
jgi:hypothetical protein